MLDDSLHTGEALGDAAPCDPELWLLDTFDLRVRARSIRVPVPAQRLLGFLGLQHRPVQRRAVAAALWADLDDRAAAARLRSTLWRLPTPDGARLVDSSDGRVVLAPHVRVDVRLVEQAVDDVEVGIAQLSGDVLTDWDEPWVEAERERFRQLRLHRLEELSDRACAAGRHHQALQAALAAVAVEPLRESAHRRVMQAHLAEGNPAEALRQYECVRRLLREQLGLAPTAATRQVVAPLLGRPLDLAG